MFPFHFFASSVGEWRVGNDIETLIKTMKRSNLDFKLWKIPGDITTEYRIKDFSPVVYGRTYLGLYKFDGKKWTQSCKDKGAVL